jgi:hypothetical protein
MSNNENDILFSNENDMSIINKNENDNNINNSSLDTLNNFIFIIPNKQNNLELKNKINIPIKIQNQINELKINNKFSKKKSNLYKLFRNKNTFINNNFKIKNNLSKSINKNFINYKIKLENEKELKQFKMGFNINNSPFGLKEFKTKFNKKYNKNRSLY